MWTDLYFGTLPHRRLRWTIRRWKVRLSWPLVQDGVSSFVYWPLKTPWVHDVRLTPTLYEWHGRREPVKLGSASVSKHRVYFWSSSHRLDTFGWFSQQIGHRSDPVTSRYQLQSVSTADVRSTWDPGNTTRGNLDLILSIVWLILPWWLYRSNVVYVPLILFVTFGVGSPVDPKSS